jgi:hypothetical protein
MTVLAPPLSRLAFHRTARCLISDSAGLLEKASHVVLLHLLGALTSGSSMFSLLQTIASSPPDSSESDWSISDETAAFSADRADFSANGWLVDPALTITKTALADPTYGWLGYRIRDAIIGQVVHCLVSHSFRHGQPAVTQSCSSWNRHNVDRPILTGRGIHPAASHDRHVRSDLPHVDAACLAVISSVVVPTPSTDDSEGNRICLISIGSFLTTDRTHFGKSFHVKTDMNQILATVLHPLRDYCW